MTWNRGRHTLRASALAAETRADKAHTCITQRKAQYKSAIWWHSPAQEAEARAAIAALEARHGLKVVTDLLPASEWTDAEESHQQFYFKMKAKRNLP